MFALLRNDRSGAYVNNHRGKGRPSVVRVCSAKIYGKTQHKLYSFSLTTNGRPYSLERYPTASFNKKRNP